MISSKKKSSGLKIPFLATSMRPEENTAPTKTPKPATTRIVRIGTALEPIAEFRKFTASLLTPTTRSAIARRNKRIIREIYSVSIPKIKSKNAPFPRSKSCIYCYEMIKLMSQKIILNS
jgi:hypothetical protein